MINYTHLKLNLWIALTEEFMKVLHIKVYSLFEQLCLDLLYKWASSKQVFFSFINTGKYVEICIHPYNLSWIQIQWIKIMLKTLKCSFKSLIVYKRSTRTCYCTINQARQKFMDKKREKKHTHKMHSYWLNKCEPCVFTMITLSSLYPTSFTLNATFPSEFYAVKSAFAKAKSNLLYLKEEEKEP